MRRRSFAAAVLVTSLVTPLYAIHWDVVRYQQAALTPPVLRVFATAVGCELRGCCPGCPLTDPIDREVRVDGFLTQEVRLRFSSDNFTMGALRLTGNAHQEGNTIVVGPGVSSISGFPMSDVTPMLARVQ